MWRPFLLVMKTMRIGLLLVGDELLTGKIQDLNGFLVAQVCFKKGIRLAEIRVVADEMTELAFAVREMSERFDIVITSGGIGPTHDDQTYAAIAQAFDVPLEIHESTKEKLTAYLLARGKEINGARLKMVTFPAGSKVATIPDLWLPLVSKKNIYILPGVPSLFALLLEPVLAQFEGEPKYTREIGTQIAEGDLAEVLEKALEKWPDVIIGSYPQDRNAPHRVKVTLEGILEASVVSVAAWLIEKLQGKILN